MSQPPIAVLLPVDTRAGAGGRERVAAQREHASFALSVAARRCGAKLGPLRHDSLGAPLPSNGWHRSLSHARGLAAAALHGAPLGIDVERPRALRADRVDAVLSRRELEVLGPLDELSFARAWTAKEAVLKKAAVGLLELASCVLVGREGQGLLLLEHRGRVHEVWQRVVHGHLVALTFDGGPPAAPPQWLLLDPPGSRAVERAHPAKADASRGARDAAEIDPSTIHLDPHPPGPAGTARAGSAPASITIADAERWPGSLARRAQAGQL
ncbi:MAG TPA: 4'-phosphopantetheinyl transferase superfamily protein [Planctomycetota bacterium]|nr:4'-phosphopantetheinyl transferase superfamily protein [Planctomycetota bacterium]